MGAAILRPAICVSDVMKKVGVSGKGMKHVTSHRFLIFIGEECTNMAAPLELNLEMKRYFVCI